MAADGRRIAWRRELLHGDRLAACSWLLNDRTFEMEGVAPNETVSLGCQRGLGVRQRGGGMMGMRMAHPLHLHGSQFRVLSRQVDPRVAPGVGVATRRVH